jgi:transposase
MLREKNSFLEEDNRRLSCCTSNPSIKALQDEIDRLSHQLMERERQADRDMAD